MSRLGNEVLPRLCLNRFFKLMTSAFAGCIGFFCAIRKARRTLAGRAGGLPAFAAPAASRGSRVVVPADAVFPSIRLERTV